MSKIYVRTNANNAEGTIRRAIESVLNQTYKNFLYYINDNGSTDGTRKIIEEYAEKDARIVPFYNKKNRVYEDENIRKNFCELTQNIEADDYFCYLDADDEYDPRFLEEMLYFMEKNRLDIGCCGSYMLNVKMGNLVVGARQVREDLIIEGEGFQKLFPFYHQFARTVWGKLYRGFTLKERVCYDPGDNLYPSYGADTTETLRAFSRAGRVGISSKILHKYYIYEKSDSYRFDPRRVISDQLLHNMTIEYLEKFGPISQENMNFLYRVYSNAIVDTIEVVLNSQECDTDKLKQILIVISCPLTCQMFRCKQVDDSIKRDILNRLSDWTMAYGRNAQEKITLIAYLCSFAVEGYAPELNNDFYSMFPLKTPKLLKPILTGKLELALKLINSSYRNLKNSLQELNILEILLLVKLKRKDEEVFENCYNFTKSFSNSIYKFKIKSIMKQIMYKNIILRALSFEFIIEFSQLISLLIQNKKVQAFEFMVGIAEAGKVSNEIAREFYFLGQNLACLVHDQAGFLFFKKLTILHFIKRGLIREAQAELSDFDALLPDDDDFKEFRRLICQSLD